MRRLLVVALLLSPTCLTSCGVRNLDFVQDDRVTITAPADRSTVRLPLRITWTGRDVSGSYAVFVDRAPVPGGRTLASLADDDDACTRTPGCPDAAWFAERNVYATATPELTLISLPRLAADDQRSFHEVTVVLLDPTGRRVGESAFSVEFKVPDPDG